MVAIARTRMWAVEINATKEQYQLLKRSRGSRMGFKTNIALAAICLSLGAGVGSGVITIDRLHRVVAIAQGLVQKDIAEEPPTEEAIAIPKDLVLSQILESAELTTQKVTREYNMDIRRQTLMWPGRINIPVGVTSLSYRAVVNFRIGIDLAKLKPEDIVVSQGHVAVLLPPITIHAATIDVEKSGPTTPVKSEWFADPEAYLSVQKEAQKEALQALIQEICKEDILGQAESSTSDFLAPKLASLSGVGSVELNFRPHTDCTN